MSLCAFLQSAAVSDGGESTCFFSIFILSIFLTLSKLVFICQFFCCFHNQHTLDHYLLNWLKLTSAPPLSAPLLAAGYDLKIVPNFVNMSAEQQLTVGSNGWGHAA